MAIKLFDSLSRELRELAPAQPDGIFRFYNCGPTVWGPAHIGNFRTFVANDVVRRLLELDFPGRVKHVRNLTDVDDRTISQARAEGRPLGEIARKWTELFHRDCSALNCLPPHVEPTATGHIREQVNMIDVLLEKGNAYRSPDGSVYFKISSFSDYGRLSHIRERDLQATQTALDDDHKDDAGDFALWKAYKPEEDGGVRWPGPNGASEGRPGWHIECSAMIKSHLGDTIDLHTGGVDLLFPHHENEIAQSECCNGVTFARHWYHSEHLLVDGTTMSKSKGNYYTLGDLTAKGYPAMAVRYALLAGHPRKQLNFTLESLHAAESALKKLRAFADQVIAEAGRTTAEFYDPKAILARAAAEPAADLGLSQLREDLNTPDALGHLFTERRAERGEAQALFNGLSRMVFALGLDLHRVELSAIPTAVAALAERRMASKKARDFAQADALRKEIAEAGWSMLDGKDGAYRLEPLRK